MIHKIPVNHQSDSWTVFYSNVILLSQFVTSPQDRLAMLDLELASTYSEYGSYALSLDK
jgi:hypothetical protein